MIQERCEASAPKPPPENDNHDDGGPMPEPPNGHFDEKAWRKNYMREYMKRKRERLRREKAKRPQPEGLAG